MVFSCFQWLLLAQALLGVAVSSDSCHFPPIFNFGDSNSDTGELSTAFGVTPPPYDESFFAIDSLPPSHPQNHNIIAASSLGLPFLSAYLNSVSTNFSRGEYFATARCTIRQPYATLNQSGFSPDLRVLPIQVSLPNTHPARIVQGSTTEGRVLLSSPIYSRLISAKMTSRRVTSETGPLTKSIGHSRYLEQVCSCHSEHLLGGRKILLDSQHWVFWLPPLCFGLAHT
ncbi:hypothetical protein ZIOFF_037004 [Zingiber officinale]|uniref:Uncharacterized protein n=1 Tax=Zingiber officinale TaxID=94328 RepID=A0A8J5KZ55_ZINOF|nr:hypothetical protein ZIOFF_037004 [Zingiber officinale]